MKVNALAILRIDRLIYNKGLDLRGAIALRRGNRNFFGMLRMLLLTSVGQGFGAQLLNPAAVAAETS